MPQARYRLSRRMAGPRSVDRSRLQCKLNSFVIWWVCRESYMRLALRRIVTVQVGLFCCVALQNLSMAGPLNPYGGIVARNIFHLRPPPPRAVETVSPPLPTLLLTGITTILGKKQALLKIRFPPSLGHLPKEESCILAEGEKDGAVQVLEIEVKEARVRVSNSGTLMTLTFQKNGSAAPVPAPRPVWTHFAARSWR